jgi:hypothetical protein
VVPAIVEFSEQSEDGIKKMIMLLKPVEISSTDDNVAQAF